MSFEISRLCRRELVTIAEQASVRDAAVLMCESHVGALVVVDDAQPPRVRGLVTDRDLALDVLGRDEPRTSLRIGELAKGPPVSVRARAGLGEAVDAMQRSGVRRLLVVDDEGGVLGLVAAEDLMAAVSDELAGLVRALRSGIARERGERGVFERLGGMRPVFHTME
ncbi:CBS domain-containing protein [Ramlibacter rhizophilus]|uniref:CBS domain-containing protein n=1 Tax=Ramlibacter rhizophilus TaxID=1781167 RepID=A0A4Z0C3D0_9BURK|nr:CBS domain-containing protein [Ramlibacter rhizophilus]TFZ04980.1 CBS domain-containing protein [Ramlibacter rhizophilus]